MPLETTTQNFNIVLRNDDFSTRYKITDSYNVEVFGLRIGKWIEVTPTVLLSDTKKLFIDSTNNIYNINNLNQALRFIFRPLIFNRYYLENQYYDGLMCKAGSDASIDGGPFATTVLRNAFSSQPVFYLLYPAASGTSKTINTAIYSYDSIQNTKFKEALGEIPQEYIVNTFYLSGKFLANQPHIEHINSGTYTIYNNLRAITLPAEQKLNDFDYNDITNGFSVNTYLSNPVYEHSTYSWSWDYAVFTLNLKYIHDIIDLANNYLSYGIPYQRYIVIMLSGNPSSYFYGQTGKTYNTSAFTYSAFEFFLAPVGEVN